MFGGGHRDNVEKSDGKPKKLMWVLKALLLGQLLAFCNALSGVFNQIITSETSKSLPACQTALNYIFICLTYGIYQFKQNGLSIHLSRTGFKSFANAMIDVEAWYWIYKAYNLTSLTSVQSLDCLSIPVVILISRFLLHKSYNWYQYGAVLLSILGVLFIVYSDYDPQDSSTVEGDIMCALGALLFGVSTVCQEWILEDVGVYEYMGTVCWYAILLSGIKVAVLEGDILVRNVARHPHILLWMLALGASQFVFYSAMPAMLLKFGSGAATINILAADVYAAVAGVILFSLSYDAFYITGMAVTCIGIIIYTLKGEGNGSTINDGSSDSLIKYSEKRLEDDSGPIDPDVRHLEIDKLS